MSRWIVVALLTATLNLSAQQRSLYQQTQYKCQEIGKLTGDMYADTARFIGHENVLKSLKMPPANTALPQNIRVQDTNGNGLIEKAEAQGNLKNQFDLYDANKDGALSGAEIVRGPLLHVRTPDLTYTDRININLGDKRVEVMWKPTGHAD